MGEGQRCRTGRNVHDRQGHVRVDGGQRHGEQVAAGQRVVVDQQHVADADAGRAQFGDRAGLALADLRDAVAAGEVEVEVAAAAEDADGQRRRLARRGC